MDSQRTTAIQDKIFLSVFVILIFFFAVNTDSVWHSQILITLCFILFLGVRPKPALGRFDSRSLFLLVLLVGLLFISTSLSINKLSSVPTFFSYLVVFFLLLSTGEERKPTLIKGYIYASLFLGFVSSLYSLSRIVFKTTPQIFSIIESPLSLIAPVWGSAFYSVFLIATFPFVLEGTWQKRSRYSYVFFLLS